MKSAATSAFGLPTSFWLQSGRKPRGGALSARQLGAGARLPEEKLAVQIRHVDAVEVNHVNISEARERQVLQDLTSCENVS